MNIFSLLYKIYPFYTLGRYLSGGYVIPLILVVFAVLFFSTIGKYWGFYCYIADIITIIYFCVKGEVAYATLGILFIALNLFYFFVIKKDK